MGELDTIYEYNLMPSDDGDEGGQADEGGDDADTQDNDPQDGDTDDDQDGDDGDDDADTDDEEDDTDDGDDPDDDGGDTDDTEDDAEDDEEEDDDADEEEDDDGAEPPTRKPKTNKEFAARRVARKKAAKKAAKKSGDDAPDGDDDAGDEDDDSDLTPDQASAVDRRIAKAMQPFQQKVDQQEVEAEIASFLKDNPDFKPFANKVKRFAMHPSRAQLPVKSIFYEVAGDKLMRIGAQRKGAADQKARKTRTGGGNADTDGKGNKSYKDMPLDDFGKELEAVKVQGSRK